MRPAHTHLGSSDERLALYILHTLPRSMGIPFVPEHLETRRLFSQLMPGLEQVAVELLIYLPLFSLAVCETISQPTWPESEIDQYMKFVKCSFVFSRVK